MASRESFEETPQNNTPPNAADAEHEASGKELYIKLGEETTQNSLSPTQLQGIREECMRTALALTAFFDDEASEVEALLARTHLEECAHCVVLQNSWAGQSQMLRGLTAPLPPGLLTRLLTAIRLLSAFPQLGARLEMQASRFEPKSGARRDMHLLSESLLVSSANPFAPRRQSGRRAPKIEAPRELPPLDPLSPLPPANLRDEILRRTVGLDMIKAGSSSMLLDSANLGEKSELDSEQAEQTLACEPQSKVREVTGRKTRFAKYPTTLVPALAACMMLLSGQNSLWWPGGESIQAPREEASSLSITSSEASKASKPASKPIAAKLNAVSSRKADHLADRDAIPREMVSDSPPVIETVLNEIETVNTAVLEPQVGITQMPPSEKQNTPALNAFQSSTGLAFTQKAMSLGATPEGKSQTGKSQATKPQTMPHVVLKPVTAALPKEQPATSSSLPKVTAVAHRADVTADELETRTRRASWSAPVSSMPSARRVNWAVANTPLTAPQTDGDNIETDAETLEHINRLNDDRPEGVRSVLDEYRASLLAATGEDESAPADPQG